MNDSEKACLIPILTVMADFGNAPFLWLNGGNICDATYWDESFPMSEGLWRKFAAWAIEFEQTGHYLLDSNADFWNDWDWVAFNARGLQLSCWLKEEVGDEYRVVYDKPCEDPNHRINGYTEILADGRLAPLPPLRSHFRGLPQLCEHIVSGGQTGADRGALDFAIASGYTHGGWAPHGREAEDGFIPLKYQLTELVDGGYRERTRRNVEDSDGTLIVNLGELDGGTLTTQAFAQRMGKPYLVVQVGVGVTAEAAANVLAWLREHAIKILNIAGPRESKRLGIYRLTAELLEAAEAIPKREQRLARLRGYANTPSKF